MWHSSRALRVIEFKLKAFNTTSIVKPYLPLFDLNSDNNSRWMVQIRKFRGPEVKRNAEDIHYVKITRQTSATAKITVVVHHYKRAQSRTSSRALLRYFRNSLPEGNNGSTVTWKGGRYFTAALWKDALITRPFVSGPGAS